jgi:hypothetical protein
MNEELKIIIKAVTDEAEKSLEGVRKELDNINKTAKDTKAVDQAMRAVGKGALAAVAGVAALTTAMVALGKSSLEFQKAQARLNAGFASVGLSAQQAGQTYKELYSYLGDTNQATEAANLLAQLTQDEANLADWTNILMGVYAKFPDSLPVESLAEAANHTAHLGEVQGTLADALEWSGVSVEGFNAALANTNSVAEREALIRQTLNALYGGSAVAYRQANQALLEYNASQVAVDQALADATAYVIPLMTSLNQLSATLLSVLRPAFENISAVLVAFIQWVIAAIKAVGAFFGVFNSKGSKSTNSISSGMGVIANNSGKITAGINKVGGAFDNASKSAEKLKRQTMGFDELNVVSPTQSASGGGAGGGAVEIPDITIPEVSIPTITVDSINLPGLDEFEQKVSKIKEHIDAIAILVGIVAGGLVLWKIADFLQDLKILKMTIAEAKDYLGPGWSEAVDQAEARMTKFQSKLMSVLSAAMMIAGAFLTIKGFSDIIVNGADWGNLALLVTGLALALGGLAIAMRNADVATKQLTISIGLLVAGIVLMVAGVIDFINNGPTVQNTILILGGAVATAVALATMGIGPLIAAIIGLVAAVAAFTAAILLEKPAIMDVNEAQEALTEAKNRATEAENGYINAVDAAEAALDRLKAAEEAAGMTGEELYKKVQEGTLDYKDMDDAQRELYKAYMDNEQKQKDLKASTEAFNEAKKAETLASYEHQLALAKESGDYDTFKKSVVDAYESGQLSADEARMMIEKSMSEMSDASQKTFMEDLPGDITNGLDPHRYESTGTKIKKWFGGVWQGIKDVFSSVGNWFKDVFTKAWEGVKNVFSKGGKIFDGIKDGILNGLKTVINGIITGINKVIAVPFNGLNSALRTIKGISIAGIKPFSWISTLSVPQIPQLATGGITTGATLAMIGERGKEAVLPLENNTQWMDTLADRISGRQTTPSKIVLMLDGRELGWATINNINAITKQTGGIQLLV